MKNFLKPKGAGIGLIIVMFFLLVSSTRLISIPEAVEKNEINEEFLSPFQLKEINRIFVRDKVNQLQELLEHSYDYYDFNGHLLLSYKGEVIFNNYIGYADFNPKDSLTNNSVYQLASVSKQFTAMAIMILKERDSLDYKDKMIKYIPELGKGKFPYYDSISIKHLLNHTSGLSNYMYYVERYTKKEEHPYNDEVIKLLAEHKRYLNFVPGNRFQYSNTGYIILALIVERITGKSFADFVKENIFIPLEMNDSFVYSRAFPDENHEKKLIGYRKHRRFYPIPETQHDGVVGDKGIYSTAMNLYKWDRALYTDLLVSKETLEEAFQPGKLNNGKEIAYGFGFRIKDMDEGQQVVYHNGLWNGFRTGIFRNINNKNTIIILDHSNCRGKGIITRKLEKILFSPADNYTQVLVEKAIKDGPERAIDVYQTLNKLNLDVTINIDDLKEIHRYLHEIDKRQIASHIEKLMKTVSKQLDS